METKYYKLKAFKTQFQALAYLFIAMFIYLLDPRLMIVSAILVFIAGQQFERGNIIQKALKEVK